LKSGCLNRPYRKKLSQRKEKNIHQAYKKGRPDGTADKKSLALVKKALSLQRQRKKVVKLGGAGVGFHKIGLGGWARG